MTEKKVPFTKAEIEKVIEKYPTPFHIYDEKAILDNAKAFLDAFKWAAGFNCRALFSRNGRVKR